MVELLAVRLVVQTANAKAVHWAVSKAAKKVESSAEQKDELMVVQMVG